MRQVTIDRGRPRACASTTGRQRAEGLVGKVGRFASTGAGDLITDSTMGVSARDRLRARDRDPARRRSATRALLLPLVLAGQHARSCRRRIRRHIREPYRRVTTAAIRPVESPPPVPLRFWAQVPSVNDESGYRSVKRAAWRPCKTSKVVQVLRGPRRTRSNLSYAMAVQPAPGRASGGRRWHANRLASTGVRG